MVYGRYMYSIVFMGFKTILATYWSNEPRWPPPAFERVGLPQNPLREPLKHRHLIVHIKIHPWPGHG